MDGRDEGRQAVKKVGRRHQSRREKQKIRTGPSFALRGVENAVKDLLYEDARRCECIFVFAPATVNMRHAATAILIFLETTGAFTEAASSTSVDILFVLHDAGETYFIHDAMTQVASAGWRVGVLALGEPAHRICSAIPSIATRIPSDLGVRQKIADGRARNATLTAEGVSRVLANYQHPIVVVVGMAYVMQAQLAAAFRDASSQVYTIGIEDGIGGGWNPRTTVQRAFLGPPWSHVRVQEVLVADSMSANVVAEQSQGMVRVTLTGSGAIESWRSVAKDKDLVLTSRHEMLEAHGARWPTHTILIVFAGGYGGTEYVQGLKVFCDAVTLLRSCNFGFVFSPHPGYPSSFEQSLFNAWGCGRGGRSNLKVVDPEAWTANGTAVLVAGANASASIDSTVAAQSLAIGKPHVYLSPKVRNVFIEDGLIPVAPNASALVATLNVSFRHERFTVPNDAMWRAGVPANGTANQEFRLLQLLRRTQRTHTREYGWNMSR